MNTPLQRPLTSFDFDPNCVLYNALARKAISLDLREGAPLLYPDQKQDSLYFVKKGVLRSYIRYGKKELTRWFYSTGDLAYSPLCFFHELPSDFCLEAACPSTVMQIYKTDCAELCDEHPAFKEVVNNLQASFLYKYFLYNDSAKTLPHIERYRKFLDEFPLVSAQVQIRHLASFLGVNPDTLSRTRREFQKQDSRTS